MDGSDLMPDKELSWISKKERENLGIRAPYLTQLLLQHDGPIEYNEMPLQSQNDGVNDCGRWCMAWVSNSDLPLEAFQRVTMDMPNRDEFISEAYS